MRPLLPKDWNEKCAAHLLVRTCWGATPEQITRASRMRPADLLAELTTRKPEAPLGTWPAKFDEPGGQSFREVMRNSEDDNARRAMIRDLRREEEKLIREIRGWWLQEMSTTEHPLHEHMTLFWHGHFVSSFQKVRSARLMWRQNRLFRTHALGSMRNLATAVVLDPAMMRYLDLARNRAGSPNENFAREFFELFLLGEGNYSEEDIREAARAFTGYMFNPASGEVHLRERMHDSGTKQIFGRRGNFNAEDVVGLTMNHAACAPFLAGKLWRFFSGRDASPEWAHELGNQLRKNDFQTAPFLCSMLGCREFYSDQVMRCSIKSPVHWMMGTSRSLDTPLKGGEREQFALNRLGQNLFIPPNVRGWEGGASWINSTTLLSRNDFALRLFTSEPKQRATLKDLFTNGERADANLLFSAALRRLYPVGISEGEEQRLRDAWAETTPQKNQSNGVEQAYIAKLFSLLLASPEYQLT